MEELLQYMKEVKKGLRESSSVQLFGSFLVVNPVFFNHKVLPTLDRMSLIPC